MGSKLQNEQLGMNHSTASNRLVKDLLWKLIWETNQEGCHRCGKGMTRDTFSIEHKEAWLYSNDPVKLFFDLDNISFSHRSCNSGTGRRTRAPHGANRRYLSGCRCEPCTKGHREHIYKWREKGLRRS